MARRTVLLDDFSGGLDLVSALSTLGPGFTPNAKNFRIADYGGIEKVLGYSAHATLAANAHELFYFQKLDGTSKRLIAAEPTAWQTVDSAGTVTNLRTAMTTTTETSFVQYGDVMYGLDPQNLMRSWDGTTLSADFAAGATTGPSKGIILGIWSNRMWVAKATAGVVGMDIQWSDPADFTKWSATNTVSLGGVGTTDKIVGGMPTADGLVVFTQRSTYLIYDTTGANSVVDPARGCSSRQSLALLDGNIYGVNREGVFATSGRFAQEIVSRRVDPLFLQEQPTLSHAAGVPWNGSYLMSFQRPTDLNNALMLDLTPAKGSVMAHDYPVYAWAQGPLAGNDQRLYFIDASDRTKIRRAFSGGSFNGAQIACTYQTHFDNFGDEADLKRLHKVRVVGRGDILVSVLRDVRSTPENNARLDFPPIGGGIWDVSTWDTATWGGFEVFEGWARVTAKGRRFSLRFDETSTSTALGRDLIGASAADPLGSCGVYQAESHFSTSTRNR